VAAQPQGNHIGLPLHSTQRTEPGAECTALIKKPYNTKGAVVGEILTLVGEILTASLSSR